MKSLIILVGVMFTLSVFAQKINEPEWKTKLRDLVSRFAGESLGERIFGKPPITPSPTIRMPEIPKNFKRSTSLESYEKLKKDITDFDRLPENKKKFFNYKFVEEIFFVTRKIVPKDEDLATWLNTLEQGGSREGIYQALVLDDVYSSLEEIQELANPQLVKFCLEFSEKFLAQKLKPSSLSDLNLYSLKRIFTEKGMDILDYYEVKNLDALYRWYATFSNYVAKNYHLFLSNDIRKQLDPHFHYEWAKKMPIQHIKSEFIIKIHSVMNGLQS